MSVRVNSNPPVSGLEWTVLSGSRQDVFTGLGEVHADAIRAGIERPGWRRLAERAEGTARDRFDRVLSASRQRLPVEAAELGWLARGACVDERDLWIYNLRGDLGRDGLGCSDLSALRNGHVLIGHNEDGDGELAGTIRLITLAVDGEPCCTVVWYPGMLPANSFVATSAGLVFGMDHVPSVRPHLDGAGRHLVARHAQRQSSGANARRVLTSYPCAGGFAFDLADRDGARIDLIENVAGRFAAAGGNDLRHTNHLRLVDGQQPGLRLPEDDHWMAESRTRCRSLESVSHEIAGVEDVLAALRSSGVCNRSADIYTFCTAAVDLTDDMIIVQGTEEPWRGSLSAFATGKTRES